MAELIDKKAITESRNILNVMELFELTPYISAENLIKFVDNLPSVTEAEIRARAIDEFAECLSLGISESLIWGMLPVDCKEGVSDEIVEYVLNAIKVVAEQLKEESE